jgi:hypothetical protein
MKDKRTDAEKCQEAFDLIERYGTSEAAAVVCGVPASTLRARIQRFNKVKPSKEISYQDIPADDIPVEEIIETMCKRFKQRKQHSDAKKWTQVSVDTDLPIGVCWFGDPHLDDNGCNWPLLKRDCDLVAKTEGMYGANIGDSTNNWTGRLMREYANQDTSVSTAHKLIEWFFKDSGVNWLFMLTGNHDMWNGGGAFLKQITRNVCPMYDWRAQIKLSFKNGREILIDAAHDHKGHSQWNSLHGQQKAASMGGVAHLYIAGHRHNWALAQNECDQTGRVYHLARCRGYKMLDQYALVNGYGEQQNGSSIVTVFDPTADDVNAVRCFADVLEGADYLTYLRRKKG